MKINHQPPMPPTPIELTPETMPPTTAPKRSAAPPAKTEDTVSISQTAKALSATASSSVEGASAVELARQQKIAALKRSIDGGTYRVEPDKVAKAMIAELAAPTSNKGDKDVK